MTRRKQRRLAFAVALLFAGGGIAAVAIAALKDNVLFFYSPSDIAGDPSRVPPGRAFRIGGLVATGSVKHTPGDPQIRFLVTDGKNSIPVLYTGVLPDLFREGQGVVALGARDDSGNFVASEVLAKHDEKYMPPEVVDALKRSGHWKEGESGSGI